MNIIYITPTDDPKSAILAAMDIYVASGMQPKLMSDGKTSFTFNPIYAAAVRDGKMEVADYVNKHKID